MARPIDSELFRGGLWPGVAHFDPTKLHEDYIVPPFSFLNTRTGHWQKRKRAWISMGLRSEVGRCDNLLDISAQQAASMGYIDLDKPGAVEEWNENRRKMNQRRKKIEPGGGGGPNSVYGRTYGKVYHDHDWAEEKAGRAEIVGGGTSIFDPVLCELAYDWWCPPGGVVVDPFAGGSVRGIVASKLGHKYWGCELRVEQVAANRTQVTKSTRGKFNPRWRCGDSYDVVPSAPDADFIFSCPPYGDLEQYSDDPRDISTMTYEGFLARYGDIISRTCGRLRQDRFACFVVGNFRDRSTRIMRDFVGDTIRLFSDAGCCYYNDIILANCAGTAPLRAKGNFERGARKVVKLHQNVLVFIKGDAKRAAECIVGNVSQGDD